MITDICNPRERIILEDTRGFSLIELLIVIAVIGVIATISIPNLLQSKMAGNEASAISSVRNIVSAEMSYSITIGSGQYGSMAVLMSQALVDTVVGAGTKDGYNFVVTSSGSTFSVTARPVNYENTGTRSFYADESGVIRFTTTNTAPTSADNPL